VTFEHAEAGGQLFELWLQETAQLLSVCQAFGCEGGLVVGEPQGGEQFSGTLTPKY
jgi:hypothetical protein